MANLNYFAIGILIAILGAQIFRRPFWGKRFIGLTFLISAILIFGYLSFLSWQQYWVWKNSEITRYFLPPYTGIFYFISYVKMHIWNNYLVSLLLSILILNIFSFINKRYSERFFYQEEIYLAALAAFLVGYPAIFFYFSLAVFIYLLIHIFSFLSSRFSSQRLSLYYLWMPLAIFVILIIKWLQTLSIWKLLKF